jgi:hypothetical protein
MMQIAADTLTQHGQRERIAILRGKIRPPQPLPAEPSPCPETVIQVRSDEPAARLLAQPVSRAPTLQELKRLVCEHYGLRMLDVDSMRRSNDVLRPRHMFFLLAREFTTASLPQVGRFCGGRDHTTVHSGTKRMRKLIASDAKLAADYKTLCAQINAQFTRTPTVPAIAWIGA